MSDINQDFLKRVQAFNDGELDPETRASFLGHIAANPEAIQFVIAAEEFKREVRAELLRLIPEIPQDLNRSLALAKT